MESCGIHETTYNSIMKCVSQVFELIDMLTQRFNHLLTRWLNVDWFCRTLISVRTCTPTLSCLAVPPCIPVLLIVCKRKSPHWHPAPWRSRLSLLLSESTLSGLVAPFWLRCRPSNRCGFQKLNTTSLGLPLSTENAFKLQYYLTSLLLMVIFAALSAPRQSILFWGSSHLLLPKLNFLRTKLLYNFDIWLDTICMTITV